MFSCSIMSDSLQPHGLYPARLLCSWDFPGKNTGVDSHFLLQGIFLTQWLNPHLLYLLHWQEDYFINTSEPLRKPRYVRRNSQLILKRRKVNCAIKLLELKQNGIWHVNKQISRKYRNNRNRFQYIWDIGGWQMWLLIHICCWDN